MRNEHVVKETEANMRIDKLLRQLEPTHSRHQIQQWIEEGYVAVDNKQVKANYKCKAGNNVHWTVPEKKKLNIEPEAIPLDIIYEDDYILVINKPKGMLIHPTKQVQTNTVVNALKYYCEKLSTLSGEERPGIVHRLDKDTSGVLVVAKDDKTHAHLQNQFKEQRVIRLYETIVHGVISPNKGVIKAPIGRHPTHRLKRTVISNGKEAETHFSVLTRFNEYTHVACELITGRTHQIRVHLHYMNHPIVGDELYYHKKDDLMKGQALFAKELSVIHPHSNEQMRFKVNQPTYFTNLLKKLERMA